MVTDVLPNGNLMIRGSQEVRVNAELRILTIAGIVRPSDIGAENTISYERIAEARISYGGRGRLTEVQQPPYGQQIPRHTYFPSDGERQSVAITETAPIKTGPSLVVQLGALLVVTAVAVGTGWLSGNYLNGESAGTAGTGEKAAPAAPGKVMPAHREAEEKRADGHGAEPASPTVIPLAGITTNLAAPSDIWIRLEASIVLDEPQAAGPAETHPSGSPCLRAHPETAPDRGRQRLPAFQGRSGGTRGDPQRRSCQASPDPHVAVRMRQTGPRHSCCCSQRFRLRPRQQIDLGAIGQADGTTVGYIIQMFGLLTILSVAPGLLIMVTSFTRFVIAFSILRAGIGLADDAGQSDPDQPVAVHDLLRHGPDIRPGVEQWRQAADGQPDHADRGPRRISDPFRAFMVKNVRDKDFDLFADLARERGQTVSEETVDLRILVPAFMISEIRRGFEIGFLIVLPFLVIDLIVATITMAMGMMMLPPTVVSLPFKILFFVLIDGWNLLVGSLVRSFT